MKKNFAEVSFISFSPRNTILAMTAYILLLENSNLETKTVEYQGQIVKHILEKVGVSEIKANVKIRRKWSKLLVKYSQEKEVKDFAKDFDFSM